MGINTVKYKKVSGIEEDGNKCKLVIPVAVHSSELGSFELPFFDESNGTKSAHVLLRDILPVLKDGGVAVIDEIDNGLHLHMLGTIIELFKFKHTNPHDAQIIFTCHTPEVLNELKNTSYFG